MLVSQDYTDLMQYNQQVYRMVRTDTGAMWGFFTIYREPETAWTGLAYRKDLAEKAGYTGEPVTLADWEALLQAFKDSGVAVPLAFPQQGYTFYGEFASAFDAYPGLYAENGETVKFGFIENGFRDYLKLMSDWREKGYILSNFVDWDADNNGAAYMGFITQDAYCTDEVGASMTVFSFNKAQMVGMGLAQSPDYYRQATCLPRQTEDQIIHLGSGITYASALPLAIATTCEDIELAIRFCDFLYTRQGFEYANYGVEGVTFNYDENGEPVSTDLLLHNENGYNYDSYKFADWCWRVGLYTNLQSKEMQPDPTIYDVSDIWGEGYDAAWVIPTGITLTAEETEEYSSRYSDIQTYVAESIPKFIMGELNLDSDWDSFVASVKTMGIEHCCEIYQGAVARYNAR